MYGFYHQDFHDLSTGQYFLQAGTRTVHISIEVSPRKERDSDEDSRRLKFEPLPDGSKMLTFYLRHFPRGDLTGAEDSASVDGNSQSGEVKTESPGAGNGNSQSGEDKTDNPDASNNSPQSGGGEGDTSGRTLLSPQDGKLEKPNLNEMYLDIVHALQHSTNFESLEFASDYMKAIARFMEAAFFSLDRVDRSALEVMDRLAKEIRAKHFFPDGEVVYLQESSHIQPKGDKPTQQESAAEAAEFISDENNGETAPEIPVPQIPVTNVKSTDTVTNIPESINSNEEKYIQSNADRPSAEALAGKGEKIDTTVEHNSVPILDRNSDHRVQDTDSVLPNSQDIPGSMPPSKSASSSHDSNPSSKHDSSSLSGSVSSSSSSSLPSSEEHSPSVPHRTGDTISGGAERFDSEADDSIDVPASSKPLPSSPQAPSTSSSSSSTQSSTSTSSPSQQAEQKAASREPARTKDEF